MREHFTRQLEAVHSELRGLGHMTSEAIRGAVDAFARHDTTAAQQIVHDDTRINRVRTAIEEHAVALLATQQPAARDLRRLVAALGLAGELERIGDYAKDIAKITIRQAGPLVVPTQLWHMAAEVIEILDRALESLVKLDVVAAQQLAAMEEQIDKLNSMVATEIDTLLRTEPVLAAQTADLLFVVNSLERIADRATNIVERTIFVATGEMIELNPEHADTVGAEPAQLRAT